VQYFISALSTTKIKRSVELSGALHAKITPGLDEIMKSLSLGEVINWIKAQNRAGDYSS